MKKSLERKIIKRLPLVNDIKLHVHEKDLYATVLTNPGLDDERKMWLAYDVRHFIRDNERYLRCLNIDYIMDIAIKDTIEKFNEEVEYNEYNCDGGMYYEI